MNGLDLDLQRRLRGDRGSVLAVSFTVIAGIAALLAAIDVFPASFQQNRASGAYWIAVLLFAWWGSSLVTFGQRWLRTIRPAILLAPLVAGASLAWTVISGRNIILHALAFAAAALFASLAYRALRASVLADHLSRR